MRTFLALDGWTILFTIFNTILVIVLFVLVYRLLRWLKVRK